MDINELEQILSLLKRNEITEFELQQEGTHLKLSRATMAQLVSMQPSSVSIEPAIVNNAPRGGSASDSPAPAAPVNEKLIKVESPIVGTFYKRPSPDAEPFVKVGSVVSKGDTLCIIEAMKLMNPIESPASGKIEQMFLGDGQVAEFGEVLFLINPE